MKETGMSDRDQVTSGTGKSRRAYVAPVLHHLGSVRHLTLGGSQGGGDLAGLRGGRGR